MPTVAELLTTARDLGLSATTKMRKSELEALIATEMDRLAEEKNRAFVEANSKPIPHFIAVRLGLVRPTEPRNVPLTLDERAQRYREQRHGAVLATPAQKRRMKHKFNKHAV